MAFTAEHSFERPAAFWRRTFAAAERSTAAAANERDQTAGERDTTADTRDRAATDVTPSPTTGIGAVRSGTRRSTGSWTKRSDGMWRRIIATPRRRREAGSSSSHDPRPGRGGRKTAATLLHDGGPTMREIADQLGHSRMSITQDVYFGRGAGSPRAADALDALGGDTSKSEG